MRSLIRGFVLVGLTLAATGCSSNDAAQSKPSAAAPAGTQACVMQLAGRDVLRLAAPSDTKCTPKDGSLRLDSRGHDAVDFWVVPGAKTVDEGVGRIDQEIKSEFKNFKGTGSTALTVAGSAARRLSGTGVEADDNDPGTADVVVFKVGPNIFIACTHGESLTQAARQMMMTLVQSATAP